VLVTAGSENRQRPNAGPRGTHGFDVREMKTMQAIFYAVGPNVKPGEELKPFENVNVFPFGSASALESACRN
jgi:alkaline phosphatase D